jgi:hypothetical protein
VIGETPEATSPQQAVDPRYDAITPQPGEQPRDIVGDFLAVGGSYEDRHAGARRYLTPAANNSWDDTAGVVVLDDLTVYLEVRRNGAEVELTGQQQGRLAEDGSFLPERTTFTHVFKLEKVDGEWRIDAPPPQGVVVRFSTFYSAYRPYNVYFLDSTRTRVVPDVRWFAAPKDVLPSLLVGAIAGGPSAWLGDAVESDLQDARLQTNVVQESDRVRVYLTGLSGRAQALPPGGFAQLVWTLNQLGVGGVEVYDDGQLVQPRDAPRQNLQRLSDWRGFDPDALPVSTPGYFVRDGAVRRTDGVPVPGGVGRGDYRATAVGVSIGRSPTMAVVGRRPGGGTVLYVQDPRGGLRPALAARSLTSPSWGASADEVWTVRDGKDVVLVPTTGAPTRVGIALGQVGTIRALRLSRDGARVALVAGGRDRERLYVGVVTRENGAVRIAGNLRELDVGGAPVSDVSWSDALNLSVLVRAGQPDSALYTVGVEGVRAGTPVATSGLPGPPTAVAAAPSLPLLTVANDSIWQAPTPDEAWTRATSGPGGDLAPAYPG